MQETGLRAGGRNVVIKSVSSTMIGTDRRDALPAPSECRSTGQTVALLLTIVNNMR